MDATLPGGVQHGPLNGSLGAFLLLLTVGGDAQPVAARINNSEPAGSSLLPAQARIGAFLPEGLLKSECFVEREDVVEALAGKNRDGSFTHGCTLPRRPAAPHQARVAVRAFPCLCAALESNVAHALHSGVIDFGHAQRCNRELRSLATGATPAWSGAHVPSGPGSCAAPTLRHTHNFSTPPGWVHAARKKPLESLAGTVMCHVGAAGRPAAEMKPKLARKTPGISRQFASLVARNLSDTLALFHGPPGIVACRLQITGGHLYPLVP